MEKFIYTREHLGGNLGVIEVCFYKSAAEVALMHYIKYMSDRSAVEEYMPESILNEYNRLAMDFYGNDSIDNILSMSIEFLKGIKPEVLKDVEVLCNGLIGHETIPITKEEYDGYLEENGFAIKHVLDYNVNQLVPSYCTVSVPEAYLLRSTLDTNGYRKSWPDDDVVDEMLKQMDTHKFNSDRDVEYIIGVLAETYHYDVATLRYMLLCVLIKPLFALYYTFDGLNYSYSGLMHKLLRMVIEYGY